MLKLLKKFWKWLTEPYEPTRPLNYKLIKIRCHDCKQISFARKNKHYVDIDLPNGWCYLGWIGFGWKFICPVCLNNRKLWAQEFFKK